MSRGKSVHGLTIATGITTTVRERRQNSNCYSHNFILTMARTAELTTDALPGVDGYDNEPLPYNPLKPHCTG